MAGPTDTPGITQPPPPSRTPPSAPIQIPTRGGNRAASDPSAPGVNRSSTLGWLREMMARAPTIQPPPQPQLQPTPSVKPSRSDLSAASPSMFFGATSRRESGQLQTLSVDPETETSLINPSDSSPNVPAPTPPTEAPEPTSGYPFPTADTGISVPTTVIPAMPSGVSIQTSSGVSTIRQDPDETVSSTYFARPPRRYRSDADVVNNAPSDEDSEDVSYDDIEDRLDIEDSPDVEHVIDQPQGSTAPDRPRDIYLDMMFRDSLSELAIDIERNRLARRIEARREEDEQGAARARHATLAARAQREEEVGPLSEFDMPGQSVHFQEPLLPVAVPTAPQPIKWAKGFQKGISRLFGREARATPDLEIGDQRIPYAQKGKGKAIPPPPKAKPNRDSPTTSLLQRLKGKPVPRGDFLDMSSDHGSPLQLPAMPSIAGVTRKLSFRRQPQSPKTWLDMGSDPFARDPLRLTEYDKNPVRNTESAPPSRLSTVYERATRALTIKKRPVPAPFVYEPNMSKAEQILGMDLSSYKATQSYPDLLQPIPRHRKPQASNPNLRNTRPATSSGLRTNDLRAPTQPRPTSFSPTTSLRVPSQARPTSFAGNHPFYTAGLPPREPLPKPLRPREPLPKPVPPREPLSKTTEAVKKDLGKWFKGLSRPSTADGTRRTSWAPINPVTGVPDWRRSTSDRRASAGSRGESVANRLERMVSDSSSQLEPTRVSSQLEARPARLYPGGIDPIADPELYRIVQQFELHRRAEDERRAEERRVTESPGLHISATSFPMPPTPRQVPVRRSSLPRQPVPTSPRLLSPSAMPRGWRTPSPVHSLQVVQEDGPAALVLGPPLPAPTPAAAPSGPAPSPTRVESSPGALAGYEALSPVHPIPQTTPNVLGLSTAPSTSTSSRVSFAPSPPRHSHVDLKEFLMTSPSQISRTTSAAEFRRPIDTGPLIPDYPASYRELMPYILSESDVLKRQDQEYSSSEDFDIWPPEPRYTWKPYRMVLTSAQRELYLDHRSHDLPSDVETKVCIHLFKIRPRSRPATAPGSKMPATPAKYDPEVTRRVVGRGTVILTFQPFSVETRDLRRGHVWKDEDNEVDVTEISDAIGGRPERIWHLILPSLDAFDSWSYIVNRERDCLVAGQLGCGIAFRDHIGRGLYPTSKARQALLHREVAAAEARWSTRYLPDTSPPHSPIRPAPKIPPGTPSKSILKKRASTGDIRSTRPDIGPVSHMQGYIDGLQAFETAYDEERNLREERYRAEGLYDDVPRIRTITDSTIRPDTRERAEPTPTRERARPAPTGSIPPEPTRSERIAQPGPFARPSPTRPPPDRSIPVRPAPIRTPSSRPYASTSQLDDSAITRASRHRGETRPSQTLSPLEPTPALSDVSLPSTQGVQSPDDFITILPRRRRPKSASARRPVPPEPETGPLDEPENTRSYQDDSPNEGLNDFVNGAIASLEESADIGDTDHINTSNPPSPVVPPCADPTTPPRPPRPGSWLDVSAPSTVLPIHFSHLPITFDRDPPIFGDMWPFGHRHPINMYNTISREATAYLSRCVYVKTVKSLDDLRARNTQMEMLMAGGPLGMASATIDQVFVFPKPTGPSEEKAVPMEEVLGLLDANAESATLALRDMNAEERRIAKGKDKEGSAEHLSWMKGVVDGMRDGKVAEKENLPPKKVDKDAKSPKGKEVDPSVNLARMGNLLKRLKGKEIAQKQNSRIIRLIRPKATDKENIPIKEEGNSIEVKKEILDIGKGKGKEIGKSETLEGEVEGTNAQSKPVTPPKAKLEGPSSIRSTRSNLSLRSTRSATKAAKGYPSSADPTPENLSSDKMPNSNLSSASHSRDLQDVRQSQLRLGSTPSIPQATARVLNFDDTPDHSVVYTPFTNMSTLETPDEGTPTHRRAMKSKLRNQKRASEEELPNEAKRVKDVETREKVGGKIEAWNAGKPVEGGKENEVVVKREGDVFGNGGE